MIQQQQLTKSHQYYPLKTESEGEFSLAAKINYNWQKANTSRELGVQCWGPTQGNLCPWGYLPHLPNWETFREQFLKMSIWKSPFPSKLHLLGCKSHCILRGLLLSRHLKNSTLRGLTSIILSSWPLWGSKYTLFLTGSIQLCLFGLLTFFY